MLLDPAVTLRTIAEYSGTSQQALIRHRDAHLVAELAAVAKSRDLERTEAAGGSMDRLEDLEKAAYRILAAAEKADNLSAANGSIGQLTKIFTLYVAISAEQRERGRVDISRNPDYLKFQTVVANTLRKFPGALEVMEKEAAKADAELLVQGTQTGRNVTKNHKE